MVDTGENGQNKQSARLNRRPVSHSRDMIYCSCSWRGQLKNALATPAQEKSQTR